MHCKRLKTESFTLYLQGAQVINVLSTIRCAGWKPYFASFICQNIRNDMILLIMNYAMVFSLKTETADIFVRDFFLNMWKWLYSGLMNKWLNTLKRVTYRSLNTKPIWYTGVKCTFHNQVCRRKIILCIFYIPEHLK